jgi:aquaporin Z
MAAVYAGGHISGAHYNPAVSLATAIRGKISALDATAFIFVQLIGGVTGGIAALLLESGWVAGSSAAWWPESAADVGIGYPSLAPGITTYSGLLAEVVYTFALCHTMLHTTTNSVQDGNSYFGLAIGFTVVAGSISVGRVSGGSFNPAISILTFVRLLHSDALATGVPEEFSAVLSMLSSGAWVHFVGPLTGGLLAGLLFRFTHPSQCDGRDAIFRAARERLAPLIIEAVGTSLLCFTVATAAAPSNTSELKPLAIGSILMSQIYTGGSTSGAHYNPAVTLAVLFRRSLAPWEPKLLVPPMIAMSYVLSQLAGACLGGVLGVHVVGAIGFPAPAPSVTPSLACFAEAIATFFVCMVVLQTATVAKLADKQFFGLAIGFTVASMVGAVGPLSGGALNPAVGLLGKVADGSLLNPLKIMDGWFYLAGPLIGAVLAPLAFRVIAASEFTRPDGHGMV